MPSQDYNDDDLINGLIAGGFIIAISYGVYRILKSFGRLKKGQKANTKEVKKVAITAPETSYISYTTLTNYKFNHYPSSSKKYCNTCHQEMPQCVDTTHPDSEPRCLGCSSEGVRSSPSEPLCGNCGYDDGN